MAARPRLLRASVRSLSNHPVLQKNYKRCDPYPFPPASVPGVGRRNAVIKAKTYFKQVPLNIVKKILEQHNELEKVAVLRTTTRKKKRKVNLVKAIAVIQS
jgi:hypothetical protein